MTVKNTMPVTALAVLFCLAWSLPANAQTDASSNEASTVPDLLSLEGKTVELIYTDGTANWPLTVTEIFEGKEPDALRAIRVQFKDEKKKPKIDGRKIAEIILDDQPLDVEYDQKKRGLVHSPEKRKKRIDHLAEVKSRLQSKRHRLWPPVTPEQDAAFLAKQQQQIEETRSHFPNRQFRVVETEFFKVCTDLPAEQVNGYLASLDAMYRELCKAFGLPPAHKVWVGKCNIFAFAQRADYLEFEISIMKYENAEGTQGLCHQTGQGNVCFAGYRGASDQAFGSTMVHETTHGFVHRYLSSARAPSWLNEGMADWIAYAIMKSSKIPRRQVQSANLIRKTGTWGDFLTTNRIEFDHYGAASTLVEILLRRDKGGQFREFFRGIKEGKDADESLKDSFGLSYQDLVILYAEQLQKIPERLPSR